MAIATPARTHQAISLEALRAGKHVLVEKPLADSVSAGSEMVELAHERGLTLMADHTYCYTPVVQKIRELVAINADLAAVHAINTALPHNYRSARVAAWPTPLFREVVYRARYLRSEGRKVFTEATLHADDTLCAEAEGLFIAARPEVFERLAAARRLPAR